MAFDQKLTPGVSIIISTYNGKYLLSKTLSYILNQKSTVPIEVLLIDNASTNNTKDFADKWWLENKGSTNIGYRSYIEEKPGKYHAQVKGINKAKYSFILTCDDDNWLSENYAQTSFEILTSNANIGVLGGKGIPVFEGGIEPSWFSRYSKVYAASEQGKKSGDITNNKGCVFGAGMVLRKEYFLALNKTGFKPIISSRYKNSLLSGSEDTEICYALRLLDFSIHYDSRLTFFHFVEKRKATKNYLKSLMIGQNKNHHQKKAYVDVLNNDTKTFLEYYFQIFKSFFISTQSYYNLIYWVTNYKNTRYFGWQYFYKEYVLFLNYKSYKKAIQEIMKWSAEPVKRVNA